MDISMQRGWIEVITGSMFSGKSEELMRRLRRTMIAGQRAIVFKPALDDRYKKEAIASHDGRSLHAISVLTASEMLRHIPEHIDVIAIDEAQFFDHTLTTIIGEWADEGYRVIIAGLDQDFRGEPFHPMPHVLAIAEYVTKLHAVCAVCGHRATRTQRLVNGIPAHVDEPTVLIGATEAYEARCRHHHEVRR